MVFPPNLGLPSKEYYEDETIVRDYQNMTATVLGQFFDKLPGNTTFNQYSGSKMSLNKLKYSITPQTDMEDLVQGVVDFEVKLAAATPATQNMQVVTQYYNPMTIAEVEALLPQVSLNYLISQLASREYSPKKIIVASPSYMTTLADLLSSTKKETLQAFLVWRTIQRYEGRVADPSLQPLRTFNSQLRGLDPSATGERWRTCVNAVRSDLGWILSKFFVESAFSEEAKKFGDQIVSDIKDSFTTILDNSEWMTRNVRDRAINKVHAINQKIGYPTSNPNVLDPVALKRYYSDVTISNSTFFENRVQVVQFEVRRAWNKLGKPTQRDEWSMTVPEVNAYYYPPGNEIVFPAGIMQAPVFYDPSVPHYLTFGAYGAIAGHELSHAFDSSGSHYDETGNYTDWFDQATKQAFDTKTQCFVNQFAHYTVTSPDGEVLHVNGNLTLAENIADSGGLNVAFMAWKKREAQAERPSLALPGLKMFSHEQLFFISYANWWCDKSRPETAVQRIYTDPHSPKWVRILVSFCILFSWDVFVRRNLTG